MIDIKLNSKAHIPIYRQIIEQVKQLVANDQLKAGVSMPTVRELAEQLGLNPSTVARAYQDLGQEGILGASRRRGTIVMGDAESPQRMSIRQNRLKAMTDNFILEALSVGYRPEELEAAFSEQIREWKSRRKEA